MRMHFIKLDYSIAANGYDLDWCRLSQVVDRSDGGEFITKSQLPNRFRRWCFQVISYLR